MYLPLGYGNPWKNGDSPWEGYVPWRKPWRLSRCRHQFQGLRLFQAADAEVCTVHLATTGKISCVILVVEELVDHVDPLVNLYDVNIYIYNILYNVYIYNYTYILDIYENEYCISMDISMETPC
jgi:hypothetical protein